MARAIDRRSPRTTPSTTVWTSTAGAYQPGCRRSRAELRVPKSTSLSPSCPERRHLQASPQAGTDRGSRGAMSVRLPRGGTMTVHAHRRFVPLLALTVAWLLGAAWAASAAPGDLDPTFSEDGRVLFDVAGGGNWADAVAVLPSGKFCWPEDPPWGTSPSSDSRSTAIPTAPSAAETASGARISWVRPTTRRRSSCCRRASSSWPEAREMGRTGSGSPSPAISHREVWILPSAVTGRPPWCSVRAPPPPTSCGCPTAPSSSPAGPATTSPWSGQAGREPFHGLRGRGRGGEDGLLRWSRLANDAALADDRILVAGSAETGEDLDVISQPATAGGRPRQGLQRRRQAHADH